eukprot:jgi/Mesvir1/7119/Mv09222-RA.2
MTQLQQASPIEGTGMARFKEHYVDIIGISRKFDTLDAGKCNSQLVSEAAEAFKAEFARVQQFLDGKLRACNDVLVCLVCNLMASAEVPDDAKAGWLHAQEYCADRIGQDLVEIETFTLQNARCFESLAMKHGEGTGDPSLLGWAREHVALAFVPDCQQKLSGLTLGLSDAYELLRETHAGIHSADTVWRAPEMFKRRVTKFWVPLDKVMPLKVSLVKHLPILIFGRDRKNDLKDVINDGFLRATDASSISSIYLDNPATFELYAGRRRGDGGAALFRRRWYGDLQSLAPTTETFMERKRYLRPSPHQSKHSIKERFVCQNQHVGPLVSGNMPVDELVQWAVATGKAAGDSVQRMEALAREYLDELSRRHLAEILRVAYRRTALQLDASNDVRISLDTDVRMLPCRCGRKQRWRQRAAPGDLGATLPFAVLELKLKGECPPWMRDVLGGAFGLKEVPEFSKYVAAVEALLPDIAKQVQEGSKIAAPLGGQGGVPLAPGVNGHADAMEVTGVDGGTPTMSGNKRELSQVIGGTDHEPREKRGTAVL